ncbi:aminoacetone oxidase family FAD-binding enzyme [bacterium]|nr:aminoacetone oxidase family FAD-binding enzyme [bacterium]
MSNTFQIGVIGAGAAGLLAAAEAARDGISVVLIEKNNKAGVKILMSGGTRCNVTHNTDAKGIVRAFGTGGRFLQPSLGAFPPKEVVEMFNRLDVPTKVEETGKVFPVSNRAVHVRDALLKQALDRGVRLVTGQAVKTIDAPDAISATWCIHTDVESFGVDRIIVTSGGKSWPGCGTTGDGYGWLKGMGHKIVKPRPALVPLIGGSNWMNALSGVTLSDCEVSVVTRKNDKQELLSRRRSSLLLTHHGFSGPAAMDVSGALTAAGSFDVCQVLLDSVPQINETQLRGHLNDRTREGGKRSMVSLMTQWLPKRLANSFAQELNAECTVAELPKVTCNRLIDALKRLPLNVTGTAGFPKAEVTAGGVELEEVNPKTMESLRTPGLFIAGEVLNVDGPIGGYNFQAAFSTGRAAGIAAAKSLTYH